MQAIVVKQKVSLKSLVTVIVAGVFFIFVIANFVIVPFVQQKRQSPPSPKVSKVNSDWPLFRGSPERTGWNSREASLRPPLRMLWSQLRGDPHIADSNIIIEASPVIFQDKVFISTLFDFEFDTPYDSSIVALDFRTGDLLWHRKLGNSGIWSTPVVDAQGRLYVVTFDGFVFALNTHDGSIVWKKKVVERLNTDRVMRA